MIPTLNWKEVALLVDKLRPEVEGLFVDRIIVPEHPYFRDGYLRGEWLIRLTGRKLDSFLIFSIHPRRPYFAWSVGKGPKASVSATRSPFDLNLSKQIKGSKLLELEALPRERVVILWFSQGNGAKNADRLGLVLSLMPAAPEALLVSAGNARREEGWPILIRSRTLKNPSETDTVYLVPDGAKAPPDVKVRTEFFTKPDSFYRCLEEELQTEAFQERWKGAQKLIRESIKEAQDRIRQSQTTLTEATNEENWQTRGDLLKSVMGNPPELQQITEGKGKFPIRVVMDYQSGEGKEVQIPCDPKLTIQEQVEKFYSNSRRKHRRISEAQGRIERFKETLDTLSKSLGEPPATVSHPPQSKDWALVEKLERVAGILPGGAVAGARAGTGAGEKEKKAGKKGAPWLGRTFISKDGWAIWVGKSKDENLELTFKHARGNDIWLHVRGRPGAHAVIPVQPGKSVPLETLLDAAHLVIFYSGGENWSTTEVDYTAKKYVKRIRDSSEASYTNNKTLLIQPDAVRVKRLLI